MADYRYSVIPAGAITDPRLCLRDLQVLALMGRHNHKGGWIYRNQARMGAEIGHSRHTIKRSIARLVEAGWVEKRPRGFGKAQAVPGTRPFAAHFYRIILDNAVPPEPEDEIECDLEEFSPDDENEDETDEEGGGRPAPTYVTPSAQGVGAIRPPIRESSLGESVEEESSDEHMRREAMDLAEKIGKLVGLSTAEVWTPEWCGTPGALETFLREGYPAELLLRTARAVVTTYRGPGSIRSIRYFFDAFARAHAASRQKLPDLDLIEPGKANHAANRNSPASSHPPGGESASSYAIHLARLAAGDLGPGS